MSASVSARARDTLILGAAFVAYWAVVLRIDAQGDLGQQIAIGASTWAFLAIALRISPPEQRLQTVAMVAVATAVECLASIVWGAYRYRLGNLPSYVPPGHGLFYLMALRLSELPSPAWVKRAAVVVVATGATALVVRNVVGSMPDAVGLLTWLAFSAVLLRSRLRYLFAISFALTMTLEFYGTGLGTWTWASVLPYVGLPAANPPAAIGVGYCAMDAAARALAARARLLTVSFRQPARGAAMLLDSHLPGT